MYHLAKAHILEHRQCPRRAWLQTYRPERAGPAARATYRAPFLVDVSIKRSALPGAVFGPPSGFRGLLNDGNPQQCLGKTTQAVGKTLLPLFAAAFIHDNVFVRVDLLLPEPGGYRLVEVKDSYGVEDAHVEDVAVQAWLLRRVGVALTGLTVAVIDMESDKTMNYRDFRGFCRFVDVSTKASALEPEVPGWIAAARAALAGGEPASTPGTQCCGPFPCPFFAHCQLPNVPLQGFPPELLPDFQRLAASLRAEGYQDLRAVPLERLTHPTHRSILGSVQTAQYELEYSANRFFANLAYPRYYLDCETIRLDAPAWPEARLDVEYPFQWSCHVEDSPGNTRPAAFLADGRSDPRREFAESLLALLGDAGPIFVYREGVDRALLMGLTAAFLGLAPALQAAAARLVELQPLLRVHYYHPAIPASWPMAAVLSAIAPELYYDGLAVTDTSAAQAAFREITHPQTSPQRRAQLRQALGEYCALESWALVRVVRHFVAPVETDANEGQPDV